MSRTPRLTVTPLEDRATPATLAAAAGPYAVGVMAGEAGDAVVYAADGTESYRVSTPYGSSFTGGVRVALADVTGDGTPDLITAPGKGVAGTVNVYDGADASHTLVASFTPFESTFTGGVSVAAADLTGDGRAEVVVGADDGGGPRVIVFDGSTVTGTGTTPTALDDFLAIDDSHFRGGVRLALGDIDGDGTADLLVGAGFGGGPRVAAFDGASLAEGQQVKLFPDFFAFEQSLRNGSFVSVGDVNGDGCGDLVFGAGPGGGPRVLELDGRSALGGQQSELGSFYAGDANSRDGVQPGTMTNADGSTSVVGTDLQTGAVHRFGPGGDDQGELGGPRGGHGGGFGGSSFEGTQLTQADGTAVAAALAGTYGGTGTGTLSTSMADGSPTSTDSAVTVSLDITSATPVTSSSSSGHGGSSGSSSGRTTAPLRMLTVSGTVTITVGTADPVTLPFTGTLRVAGGTADAPRGELSLTTDRTGSAGSSAVGFTLTGVLADGDVTTSWLVLTDHTDASSGTVFQVRAARGTDPLTLARA